MHLPDRWTLFACLLSSPVLLFADDNGNSAGCKNLPNHAALRAALRTVVVQPGEPNGGLDNNMWATVVNRDGEVCAVVFSGNDRGDQWPGSRVISAQKANAANAFSLPAGSAGIFPGLALSTANLFTAVQPGGDLFGLQESNPVHTDLAYGGNSNNYGRANDFMVGGKIGGVNVFGGGLALYTTDGRLVGGLGVSGDTSCTDHVVAWKVRHLLNLDSVPSGVAPGGTDNMIQDITPNVTGHPVSASGFGHPRCLNNPSPAQLQLACPAGPNAPLAGCAAADVAP
ncbi:MAG: heme-binding protein [Bryobacteraceae bacterium]|nr:heme-binding protein [Bryobacteraceae bacterium]